jgi:hypothetical protein
MDVTIGTYKMRVEIVVLIVLAFWVLAGHLLCSCCQVRSGLFPRLFGAMTEGMTSGDDKYGLDKKRVLGAKKYVTTDATDANSDEPNGSSEQDSSTESTPESTTTSTEGFVGANNTAAQPTFAKNSDPGWIMKPDEWAMPTLTYARGEKADAGVEAIWKRPAQKLPLPEGELDLFAKTKFKPECCPNAYSTSTGCACMSVNTYDYLTHRAGNNVPYSEY